MRPTGQPTLRSGLPSSDFPFEGPKVYYEKHGSPPRQSLANLKHLQDPLHSTQQYHQITGVESQKNPFLSSTALGVHYSTHIQQTQRPLEQPTKPLGTLAHQKQNELIIGRFR